MTYTDIDHLADEIADLAAHLDAATHRFLTLIRRFDASEGWGHQGALTCAHWLSWRVGLELGAAREHVRVARALRELPLIDAALQHGQVSYSKVRALTRVATPENEGALLEMARMSTASQLERICRGYRLALRNATGERPEDEEDLRWVREHETATGLVRFEIQIRPEEAATVRRALEVASAQAWASRDVPAGTRAASLRRADALIVVAERFLTAATDGAGEAGPPVEIVVHVEADGFASSDPGADGSLDDGRGLSQTTVERLACDAAIVQVTEDSRGNVLDIGRRRRTIPTLLRRALYLRDRGCRFPGCTNRLVDGHHVVPWARGGATALDNLCSLCRRHHRYVHDLGFRLERTDTGDFRFFQADGREIAVAGVAAEVGAHPLDALRDKHRAAGVLIDVGTNASGWDGRPPDYDHIVWSLMPSDPAAAQASLD